jgi:uncharacterized RDD family membrane protein YckC
MASKTIDITTTQNVVITYELAGLYARLLAFLLDILILGIGYLLAVTLLINLMRAMGQDDWAYGLIIFLVLLPFLLFFGYNIFFETRKSGQTPGKKAFGIKVVRLDGKDPDWSDAALRTLLQLVDTFFSGGLIGALLIQISPNKRRLGDMAAHTAVIRIQGKRFDFQLKDILNISSLENYTPKYPQVRNLQEQDMVVIKTVLTRLRQHPNQAHEEILEDLVTHLMPLLGVERRPDDRQEFLKTVLRDYIVLTR